MDRHKVSSEDIIIYMSIILIVDDEPDDLAALTKAMSRRFKEDYQIESRLSPAEALDFLNRAKENNQQVALVIADQWMPQMNGIDFLVRAHEMHPSAQRALLVSWGDRSAGPAILQGCAFHQIENYLQKPWDPAEIYLYPPLENSSRTESSAWITDGTCPRCRQDPVAPCA